MLMMAWLIKTTMLEYILGIGMGLTRSIQSIKIERGTMLHWGEGGKQFHWILKLIILKVS